MNYLSELISTLNETELGGLTALNLQGREAEVFNAFVALVSNVSKNKSVSPEQLGISRNRFQVSIISIKFALSSLIRF